jgi:hypothetical protein
MVVSHNMHFVSTFSFRINYMALNTVWLYSMAISTSLNSLFLMVPHANGCFRLKSHPRDFFKKALFVVCRASYFMKDFRRYKSISAWHLSLKEAKHNHGPYLQRTSCCSQASLLIHLAGDRA